MYTRILLIFLFLYSTGTLRAQPVEENRGARIGAVNKDTVTGTSYALVIGISNYKHINSLNYADDDAVAFAEYLKSKAAGPVPESQVRVLLNEEATQAGILVKGLEWLSSRPLKAKDKVYIYFSGHGDARNPDQYFLLAYDCAPSGDKDNYLVTGVVDVMNLKVFIERFSRMGVNVILITDACRSNEIPGGEQGTKVFTRGIIEKPAGEIMMISTGMNGLSVESSAYGGGHGLFTYYLLNGLLAYADSDSAISNRNGNVDLYELSTYVSQKIAAENRSKGYRQYPKFCCEENYTTNISKVDQQYLAEAEGKKDLILFLENLVSGSVGKKNPVPLARKRLRRIQENFFRSLQGLRSGTAPRAVQYFEAYRRLSKDTNAVSSMQEALITSLLNTAQGKLNLYLAGLDRSGRLQGAGMDSALFANRWSLYRELAALRFSEAYYCQQTAMQLMPHYGTDLNNRARLEFLHSMMLLEHALDQQLETLQQQKLQDAADRLRKAIAADTSFAANYNLLGWISDLKKEPGALAAYLQAHTLAPLWPYPLNNAGSYYQDRMQWDSALYYYNEALKLDSAYITPLYNKGLVYKKSGNRDLAVAAFLRLDSLVPGQGAVYMQLGDLYQKEDPAQAIRWFQRGGAVQPRNSDFPYEMGKCYERLGDTLQALRQYRQVLQMDPGDSLALLRCFSLTFYSGAFRDAYAYAAKRAGVQSEKAAAYYDKACAASWQGWTGKGFRSLRQAVHAGYTNKTYLVEDQDLANLRKHTKRFARMLKRIPDKS